MKHRAVGAVLMTMAQAGGISPLVTMAREGTMEQKNAAAALWSLALDANIRSAIAAYGTSRQLTTIPPLSNLAVNAVDGRLRQPGRSLAELASLA